MSKPRTWGILLVGGLATRLYPTTASLSKHLLPIYDKPAYYYPLSLLLEAGIRDVVLVTRPDLVTTFGESVDRYGSFGANIVVLSQMSPRGIADALLLAINSGALPIREEDRIVLALGDNLFHGAGCSQRLRQASSPEASPCVLFLSWVAEPNRYGVAVFHPGGLRLKEIVEKPAEILSNWAVSGLYSYSVPAALEAGALSLSSRGQLEITDLHNRLLSRGDVSYRLLGPEVTWMDTGEPDSLLDAANYVHAIQRRTGSLVGSPQLAAYYGGLIDRPRLHELATMAEGSYGESLRRQVFRDESITRNAR